MTRAISAVALLILTAGPVASQEKKPTTPVVVLKLTTPKGPIPRALAHPLLPDPATLIQGNAAPHWIRLAGAMQIEKQRKPSEKEYEWSVRVPLKELPLEALKKRIQAHETIFRMADEAARFDRCDWNLPYVTVQRLLDVELQMPELRALREVAQLLALRVRFELAEGRPDRAIASVRTGFALARHLGDGITLIQQLVGAAVANVMIDRLEEIMQTPDVPNLYWSLTALPRPFVDTRISFRHELSTLHRSFPQITQLENENLNGAEVNRVLDEMFRFADKVSPSETPEWMRKMGVAGIVAFKLPEAKKALVALGWKAERLDKMPPQQVVAIHFVDEYNRFRDDMLKWVELPAWQSRVGMAEVEKQGRAVRQNPGNVLMVLASLLSPALTKVREAEIRVDRYIAALRVAEAVRLHADANGGKLPAKLEDIRIVPLPIDPLTGRGFDEFYKLKDGKAVLELTAWPFPNPRLGKIYEIRSGM